MSRGRGTGQHFWVLRPHERPDLDAGGLCIIYDTLLKLFREGVGPLESSFLETRLRGLFCVVPDPPDDTGHLGDFMYTTSKTNGDYLFDGPGLPGS